MANDYRKMRGQWKTWSPVLKAFEERIPLLNQIPTLWGKLMKGNQMNLTNKPSKDQMQVRAKLVDNLSAELPSRVPVVGAALASSLAKLSGNEKAIMLADGEFIGSIFKIIGSAGESIGKIQNFLSPKKEVAPPDRRRGGRGTSTDKRLKAPNL